MIAPRPNTNHKYTYIMLFVIISSIFLFELSYFIIDALDGQLTIIGEFCSNKVIGGSLAAGYSALQMHRALNHRK